MNLSEVVLLLGAVTSMGALFATFWRIRRSSPESEAQIVTASTLLLEQLQRRIVALEQRTAALETENSEHERKLRLYEAMYGPLPG